MIIHIVNLIIPNATAESFYNFMTNPTDDLYKKWLPEEHWAFHIVKKGSETHLGDLVFYDEILGNKKHRLTFYATITIAERPNRLVYQMRKFALNLPAYLDISFTDTSDGLAIKHEVRIGWRGAGILIDPLIRLFYNESFFCALKGHCEREWSCLAEILKDVDMVYLK